jgi:uncharacterized protein (TIGR03435 family)
VGDTLKLRLALCIGMLSVSLGHGQEKAVRLTFEVAAIKPTPPDARYGGIKPMPGGDGYLVQNMAVKTMISLMYKVPGRQIKGGPDWLDSSHWDIEAKADHFYNIDDLHTMFQNLLADRFNLKFHIETKEGPVYALMVDKSGSKMKINDSAQDFKIPLMPGPDNSFVGKRVPMKYFCWFLSNQVTAEKRAVIDRTGLGDKNFDFTLSFAPELPPDVAKEDLPPGLLDRPSLFDALKEQLGLKLQPEKGPVEYYVIDHLEKPSEN